MAAVGAGGSTLRVRLAAHCIPAPAPEDEEAIPGRFEMDWGDEYAGTQSLDVVRMIASDCRRSPFPSVVAFLSVGRGALVLKRHPEPNAEDTPARRG